MTMLHVQQKRFLADKDVQVLEDWPAGNLDVNISEPFWHAMKKQVLQLQPRNLQEFWDYCQEEQEIIPNEKFWTLFHSMPHRIEAIIRTIRSTTNF